MTSDLIKAQRPDHVVDLPEINVPSWMYNIHHSRAIERYFVPYRCTRSYKVSKDDKAQE